MAYETTYTLVNHSGLPNAVELRSVRTAAQERKIREAGGLIYRSYKVCSNAEYWYNYKGVPHGINPGVSATGGFSRKKHDHSNIFVPKYGKEEERQNEEA